MNLLATSTQGNASTKTYRHLPTRFATATLENQLTKKGLEFTKHTKRLNGTKVVVEYTIITESYLRYVDGGAVRPRIYLFNSENRECAYKLSIGFLKLVCDNGLMVGDTVFSERIVHRQGKNFETKYDAIRYNIAAALDYLEGNWEDELNEVLEEYVPHENAIQIIGNLNVPARVKTASIKTLFNPRRQEDAHQSIGCLLNIVNEEIALLTDSVQAIEAYNKFLLRDITDLAEAC